MVEFTYIDSGDALDRAYGLWSKSSCVGIDLECENNLHYYGSFISLIQVSLREQHWIIDVLRLKQVDPVLRMLEDPSIQKIFHDVSFDLRILHHQFNCRPRNVFDTQVAALLVGEEAVGLGSLLTRFFGVRKEQRFQMADWTKRPLPQDMLAYAIKDTMYLIPLRDLLENALRERNRLPWAGEEFKLIEEKKLAYNEGTYRNFRGFNRLSGREQVILKHLFPLRKQLAKRINRPPYHIIGIKRLTELVTNPPKTIRGWGKLRGVHPIVRAEAELFFNAVMQGEREEITSRDVERKHRTLREKEEFKKLSSLRSVIAEKQGILKHLILNEEQMWGIVTTGNLDGLRQWQRNLIEEYAG